MTGSISFFFHLIGFGLVFTSMVAGWILERSMRAQPDWTQKVLVSRLSRKVGLLSPIASVIMLLTGILNIINIFGGNAAQWYTAGWLVAKIILFAFLLVNGAVFGPILTRRRFKLIQSLAEQKAPEDAEPTVTVLTKSITTFYLVQFLLLLIILYLSIAGGGKHPGIF